MNNYNNYRRSKGIDWAHWFVMVVWAGVLILVTDAIGWWAWAMSGQVPLDGFYVGTITGHVLKLFF